MELKFPRLLMDQNISYKVKRVDADNKSTGEAVYLSDMKFEGMLYSKFYRSDCPRGILKNIQIPELPDGYYVVDWHDVPGENSIALINKDWPAFVKDEVRFIGEIILMIVGPDKAGVLRIHDQITADYETITPVYTMDESENLSGGAICNNNNLFGEYNLRKGDPQKAFEDATDIFEGVYKSGFQEHIYLETQSLTGTWENNQVAIYGSMQCPFYVKHAVTNVLGNDSARIVQLPTGGGFGGKEDYPEIMGCALAVAVNKIKKPIQLVFDREEDILYTTKRHPSEITIKTALDDNGKIIGMFIDTKLNSGAYESYSCIVLQRAIFHGSGVYDIPNISVRGRAFATNLIPSGAFRGFGTPQSILAIESHMNQLAIKKGLDPADFKKQYFLKKGSTTITNGSIKEDVILDKLFKRIDEMSQYTQKSQQYQNQPGKGIGISFYNHGCGFTGDGEQRIIKARVQLAKEKDGTVKMLVANTEMGQGVATTFTKIVANTLDIPFDQVIYEYPDTDAVPDSGPTVASRSVMVVGNLLQQAALELKEKWDNAETLLIEKNYKLPGSIKWDQGTMQGDAYPSYGWGINVVEIEVDPITYEIETKGVWAVHDIGKAIDEQVIEGQVAGGLLQALGWGYLEKLQIKDGKFYQKTMADYMIPTSLDFPAIISETIDNPFPGGPFGAKGAGELVVDGGAPALMSALESALNKSFFEIPLTPESIMEVLSEKD